MPGFDGTGPMGNGRGGRGLGPCGQGGAMGGQPRVMGRGRGAGQGFGMGRGAGRGAGRRGFGGWGALNPMNWMQGRQAGPDDAESLQRDLDELKVRQGEIEQRLEDLRRGDDNAE